jgi:tRNA G18 (ribose-2'-O)-methylase SpoU
VLALAGLAITIPMFGKANYINVASAAAFVLHQMSVVFGKQRGE